MSGGPNATRPEYGPVPEDDGAASGLEGKLLPRIQLPSTRSAFVDLVDASRSRLVLYVYPRTGSPGEPLPPSWDEIPGARGCTAENCAFRDHGQELLELGAQVMGLSSQPLAQQREFAELQHIVYPLLNDSEFRLNEHLGIPTFYAASMRLYKRLTLIVEQQRISKVFYPIYPPDRHPLEVMDWLGVTRRRGMRQE